MSGGVAIYTTWLYSHGLYSPSSKGIVQDPTTGEIRQQKPGVPGKPDIIVPADLNPSPKGFAIVAWDQEGWDSNPPVEVSLDVDFSHDTKQDADHNWCPRYVSTGSTNPARFSRFETH